MPVIYPVSKDALALGIIVCEREGMPPFAESRFIRRLILKGSEMGISVFAYAPWTWNEHDDTVNGWVWDSRKNRWQSTVRKLPPVAYDRSWPDSEDERIRCDAALHRLKTRRRLTLLNGRLPNKAEVYSMLSRDSQFSRILPSTAVYEGSGSLAAWLTRHHNAVFLKPAEGSHGKRTMSVTRKADGTLLLQGRMADNRPVRLSLSDEAETLSRLHRWIGGRTYIMQPLLDLRGPAGEPFDLRALMQKNERARWTITGIAARCGLPGTITANLHGGGHAASAYEVLCSLFGETRSTEIMQDVRKYGLLLVSRLEENFGRFAEIGMDFGVDRNGRLWFLEANSKPGRSAMNCADGGAADQADSLPLSYARSILLRPHGRVIHEFDHL